MRPRPNSSLRTGGRLSIPRPLAALHRVLRSRALSSAVEHFLDMEGVRGSIPLAPTIQSPSTTLCKRLENCVSDSSSAPPAYEHDDAPKRRTEHEHARGTRAKHVRPVLAMFALTFRRSWLDGLRRSRPIVAESEAALCPTETDASIRARSRVGPQPHGRRPRRRRGKRREALPQADLTLHRRQKTKRRLKARETSRLARLRDPITSAGGR